MKFSYNWIRELVPGLTATAAELERLITLKTAECEGVTPAGTMLANACVARVEAVSTIAGTHNVKAEVDTGRYGRKTVACGAPNCREGLLTAYVPLGKKVVSNIESHGMLASASELGINRDHEGIIEFDLSRETAIGSQIPGCVPDSEIEIDNKSLTNRPDLWGHLGMAREVAAITGQRLVNPLNEGVLPHGESPYWIEIEDLDLCPRYCCMLFENVKVAPSPLWLQYRLTSIGLNPINNIVDLTNLIASEIAQPMHAFDADKLRGNTLFIRQANDGEQCLALNGESYSLQPANLVIADAGGAIAIAGVIGGQDGAIGEGTTRVLFESANFQANSVRRTSAALKLRTDASMRFEKSQDPTNAPRALARAIQLMQELCPDARIAGGMGDIHKKLQAPLPIRLDLDVLDRKLGRALDGPEVRRIFQSLEFGVETNAPRIWLVTPPSYRATKDVSVADDLVEEVGRMIGYDSIAPTAPLVASMVPPDFPERNYFRFVRRVVADQGFTEVYNYSFVSEEEIGRFGLRAEDHLRVLNPIAAGQELMRNSLLPGIYRNIVENRKHFEKFRLFEIGYRILKRSGSSAESTHDLPDEIPSLVVVNYTREDDGVAELLELKRVAECLLRGFRAQPTTARVFEHPTRAAEILLDGGLAGRLFDLHPSLIEGRAAILELDLRQLLALQPLSKRAVPVRKFPTSTFDLSVLAPGRALIGRLQEELRGFAGELLEEIEFIRQYSGSPLAEGVKSVSFRLTVGAADRTLSSDEVNAIRARIINGMQNLGYELRL